jgi:hypothetical protein
MVLVEAGQGDKLLAFFILALADTAFGLILRDIIAFGLFENRSR